jgi:hypothetical protein
MSATTSQETAPPQGEAATGEPTPIPKLLGLVVVGAEDAGMCSDGTC